MTLTDARTGVGLMSGAHTDDRNQS